MIMIGFKCLGSSCLDLGLASAPDCLASISTSLPRPRSRSCLASVLAVAALPLPQKFCLGICLCLEKNALTTTLCICTGNQLNLAPLVCIHGLWGCDQISDVHQIHRKTMGTSRVQNKHRVPDRPVSYSRFSPTPADSVLSCRQPTHIG